MFEWLLLAPAVTLIAGVVPLRGKMSDKAKINKIFRNLGIGVNESTNGGKPKPSFPKFYRKKTVGYTDNEGNFVRTGIDYIYTLPLGLAPKKVQAMQELVFSDGLNKPVEIEHDGMLHVNVYDKKLDTFVAFKELPKAKDYEITLGKHYKGWIKHNFDHIPHMIVGGTTRFGKTVFLKDILTQLLLENPNDVDFYIIDLKGGLEFTKFEGLKQVKGTVARNPLEAYLLLQTIHDEMAGTFDKEGNLVQEGLYQEFLRNHWTNIVDTPSKKRKFVIVDEGAQLAPDKFMKKGLKDLLGECQYLLSEIARLGGALGYRLIFGTQYPTADILPRQIKMNADIKVSFRLGTGYASEVVLDEQGAEELPTDVKGRALVKTHQLTEIQVPYINDKEMWELLKIYNQRERKEVNVEGTDEEREANAYFIND
jgi:S-DNA-T family DNA segregation ATPase FtsK/SpoIIIE